MEISNSDEIGCYTTQELESDYNYIKDIRIDVVDEDKPYCKVECSYDLDNTSHTGLSIIKFSKFDNDIIHEGAVIPGYAVKTNSGHVLLEDAIEIKTSYTKVIKWGLRIGITIGISGLIAAIMWFLVRVSRNLVILLGGRSGSDIRSDFINNNVNNNKDNFYDR